MILKKPKILIKFSLVYSIILICTIAGISSFAFYSIEQALDNELSNQLITLAELAARQVANTIHSDKINPDIFKSNIAPYEILQNRLREIQDTANAENIIVSGKGNLVILDSAGILPPGSEYSFLKMDGVELSEVWKGKKKSSITYMGSDNRRYKSGYAPVKDSNGEVHFIVRVEAGTEFFTTLRKAKKQIALIGLLVLIVTISISLVFAKSITNPLNMLLKAFKKIGEDQRYPKLEIKTDDEFEYLGEKFNEMVLSIKEKDDLLNSRYEKAKQRAEDIKGYGDYILEGIPTGVIGIGMDRKIKTFNSSARNILEVKGQCLEARCKNVLTCYPKITSMLFENLKQGQQQKENSFQEISVQVESKKTKTLGIGSSAIYGTNGELLESIVIFSDITELKRLQDKIQLKERLAALGELSAGIAHEIRNPLSAIQGYVELLGKKDNKAKRLTENIVEEIKKLNRRISDFLEFAKPPRYDFRMTNLKNLIEMSISFAVGAGDEKYKVITELDEKPCIMPLDHMYMEGAMINLLKNAKEAMPDGGNVTVKMKCKEDSVCIEIENEGPCIDTADLDRIFNPFFTKKKYGTGLGLAIVHKTVEGHGGSIFVKTSDKNFTVFQIILPLNKAKKGIKEYEKNLVG